jgi:hypothetical protein
LKLPELYSQTDEISVIKKVMVKSIELKEWFDTEWDLATDGLHITGEKFEPLVVKIYDKFFNRKVKEPKGQAIIVFRDEFKTEHNETDTVSKDVVEKWLGLDFISTFGADWASARASFDGETLVHYPGGAKYTDRELQKLYD